MPNSGGKAEIKMVIFSAQARIIGLARAFFSGFQSVESYAPADYGICSAWGYYLARKSLDNSRTLCYNGENY